jgi:hypothetical protein
MKLITLHHYPGSDSSPVEGISVFAGAQIQGQNLYLNFELKSETGYSLPEIFLDLPELSRVRKMELWKETCFEAFLPISGTEGYYEFNASLSGDWDLFAFDSYRSGMRRVELSGSSVPRLQFRESHPNEFRIGFILPLDELPSFQAIQRVGLTLVLKVGETFTYWALHHDGAKPDFHLRTSFSYDSIRN